MPVPVVSVAPVVMLAVPVVGSVGAVVVAVFSGVGFVVPVVSVAVVQVSVVPVAVSLLQLWYLSFQLVSVVSAVASVSPVVILIVPVVASVAEILISVTPLDSYGVAVILLVVCGPCCCGGVFIALPFGCCWYCCFYSHRYLVIAIARAFIIYC